MSVIRLELEIDGEVYPELRAALVAISSDAARAERLRHLAASGLVWEGVRAQGTGARSSARGAPRAAAERRAPRPTVGDGDFVDLALDVVPASNSPGRKRASFDAPTQPIPMLVDVVNPSAWHPDEPAEEAALPVEEEPSLVVHKTVVRSRLLRMKDKGLFRNG